MNRDVLLEFEKFNFNVVRFSGEQKGMLGVIVSSVIRRLENLISLL